MKKTNRKLHKNQKNTLFRATTNGVCFFFSKLMDSIVCGSRPCIISTTRIAISQRFEPLERRLLKEYYKNNLINNLIKINTKSTQNKKHYFNPVVTISTIIKNF